MKRHHLGTAAWLGLLLGTLTAGAAEPRRLLLVAGPPSHGYGAHEHLAGFRLAAEWIEQYATGVVVTVSDGWPADPALVTGADAIIINSDGAKGSVAAAHAAELEQAAARGAGIGLIHWALDVPAGPVRGQTLDWLGGYFETGWSVNPAWDATVTVAAGHPITRGVRPFAIRDEWYFNMRFREGLAGVTPLLQAVPPDGVRERPDGPYSNNPQVRTARGTSEVLAWASERAGGGRGFGFTGLHDHWNWAHPDYRKFLLNAFVWLAGAEVPAAGVASPAPTLVRLQQDIPKPVPTQWKRAEVEALLAGWPADVR